jgi:hypothetical protein
MVTYHHHHHRRRRRCRHHRNHYHLKEEALDRTLWRPRFGRGYEPVLRRTTE